MDDMFVDEDLSGNWSLVFLNALGFDDAHINTTEELCFRVRSRSTVLQGLPFGGVLVVLALDFILWLLILLVFSCLRKAAWDYGRLALLMDNDSLTSLFYGEQSEKEKSPSETSPIDADDKDLGFCSWLLSIYHMKDEEIQSKCGIDATTYLSFQKHLMVLLLIICVLSLAVILPVNFSGDLLGKSPTNFGRTTIANVPIDDRLLWLHSIFALLYFIITVLCMAHHSIQLDFKEGRTVARTLMVTGIPKEIRDPSLIMKHFHEAYPSCTVTGVHFCSDVRMLVKLDSERRKAMKGRLYFTTKAQKEGKIMIKIHPCSRIFCCRICGFEEVDAEQYYGELEEKLTDEFNAERNRITLKPLCIAFVTFQDERMAATIYKDYSFMHFRSHPQQSSVTTAVQSHCWRISYAPAPSDIIWENLSICGVLWWVRFILLNIGYFILLFFLTTPAMVVNAMDLYNVSHPGENFKNPIVTQFFPTLLLWAVSVFLPFIVYYSSFFESHWTRSTKNQVTMHKCYIFLIFMVIILPSLGLSSMDLFFQWLLDRHFVDRVYVKFQCVFLPNNGAFFVNYVITASLIGTAMDLLRIPGLTVYATRLCFAKSEPERLHIKRNQAYEFQFGLEYAWTSCIFSVVMTYSITCPIIVPFGLLYMLLKHMVDRYNIYYVYIPTKLSQRIHFAAVSQVVTAPILCLFWLLFFSIVRLGANHPITVFTCIILFFCILSSLLGLCLKRLQPQKPSSYQMSEQTEGGFHDMERSSISSSHNSPYIPTVLQEPELALTPTASPAHLSYGTMGSRLEQAETLEEAGLQSFETELESTEGEYRTGPVLDTQTRYH